MKSLIRIVFLIFLFGCSNSSKPKQNITSFDDFINQMEDPSVVQQLKAIKENDIKRCIITRWVNKPRDRRSKKQSDDIEIYYDDQGNEKIIAETSDITETRNTYSTNNKILEKKIISAESLTSIAQETYDKEKVVFHTFEYEVNKNLLKEIITRGSIKKPIGFITYHWNEDVLKKVEVNYPVRDLQIAYDFKYLDGKLVSRKITSNSIDSFKPDRTNAFIYKDDKLVEITNTWIMDIETLENDSTMTKKYALNKEELSKMTSTRFSYTESGLIDKMSKVYGIWFKESLWVTTFKYHDNGLIKEKILDNISDAGFTTITYKYDYLSFR